MAYLHDKGKKEGVEPRLSVEEEKRMKRQLDSKSYECRRARHDAEEWEKAAINLAQQKIELHGKFSKLKRNRCMERIGWLLLSISLALAHLP